MKQIILSFTFFFSFLILSNAQFQINTLYTYQDLSNSYYTKIKDSLKKNWLCPAIYSEKERQKKYKEFWDSRTDFICNAIDNQNFIYCKGINNYIKGIIDEIISKNRNLFSEGNQPLFFLDRSPIANAYALGNNVIIINLGFINHVKSREELAMALAHELSHNLLFHIETVMKEKAELLTSDEYKKNIQSILDSKYGRYSRLKKIVEGYSFSRSRHQRYHESDADSLAIILLKKSNITFNANFFLRLDSTELQLKQPLLYPIQDYFIQYNLPSPEVWAQKKSKGLSTKTYSFTDTPKVEDSLKTHPDCIDRYKKNLIYSDSINKLTSIPSDLQENIKKIILWNIYDNMDLTVCLYIILQEKDKGQKNEWYDFMVYNIFSGLLYNDNELQRFIAIGVKPKELITKDYYNLQNILEQIPRENLKEYVTILQNASFWKSRFQDEIGLRKFLYLISVENNRLDDKTKSAAANDFSKTFPTSLYNEFTAHFKKNR
ncbi:MAG: peptidase M48 Ste24p [Chitinophaga sp.]|jgi:hypothetical protein|nr:peptidase M48 Ste24p [Chitinophaga sp.]